ncbi:dTDP-4-dehydrorhamnose reductase [Synechococcales cyanobacterium C]|uniref:dTDP-4-dehydrorhamnose reductase n=1 Tax=Petrachloros mirabilis ULC683 TaxID=2781853 RepID=A0A8K2A6X2_9CYAN|nr:dTDP-4-dehydrorhamnose reductase [Petrachloros mirabilis]NCJ05545.1 dTDP-4-dehydrorhamnose reductase [Petrachloros mirabilis ULC683]
MVKILLMGAQGQVGIELQHTLSSLGAVIALGRSALDLTQRQQIDQQIEAHQPQVIVNAAAYTAVDKAEAEPDLAAAINAIAPGVMAEAADRIGATLVHLSTDYVFDGTQSQPYREDSPTHPQSVYGHTKQQGEEAIRQACDRHFILRTAWVYGAYGKSNFVKTMLRLGAEREELRVVMDQVGSPTWARDIGGAIAALLQAANTSEASLYGTYHFTNSGVASWYDFAVAIFEEAQYLWFPLQVKRVVPITTAEFRTPAHRPAYSVLSTTKIAGLMGTPPHWRTSLRKMLAQWQTHQSLER